MLVSSNLLSEVVSAGSWNAEYRQSRLQHSRGCRL